MIEHDGHARHDQERAGHGGTAVAEPGPGRGGSGHEHGGHDGHAPGAFRRKFWLSLALTVPIVVTSGTLMDWFGYRLDFPGIGLVGPVLGTAVFLYGGWPFLAGAVREAADRAPGMMLLIATAITVAFAASAATAFGLFDLDFWWELAALVTIMLLGHWQEMKAIGQARGALTALAALLPDQAERIGADGAVQAVPVDQLAIGDVVLVRSGARVPADGRVVDGSAELDESMITGESSPVARGRGDRVVAGTVATDSAIRVEVDAVGRDTALAGIERLVAEAQDSTGRAQALADRFAALLFYIAMGAAAVTFGLWTVFGTVSAAVVRTVTVLVIACPHALGLAIPLVVAIATAVSARAGMLVKDRLALERMRLVDAVVFDKTGTLTSGEHTVVDVVGSARADAAEVLRLAAAVESDSEHPLARAIVSRAVEDGARVPEADDFRSRTGRGVEATVEGRWMMVGGPALLREIGAEAPDDPKGAFGGAVDRWRERGATVLYLVVFDDGPRVLGALALADSARPEAKRAIEELRGLGVGTIAMITGDARQVAQTVAEDLGFEAGRDEVFAEVLPADKDRAVARMQSRGLTVAMVGDGVNDAPALARADVGIAIGAGTDVAIESAGVVLASSDPRGVPGVIRLSQASYRKMVENLVWAAGYNVVAIPLAAGALAWAGFTLSPAVGAVLMSVSTIVVALNAQLLRRVRPMP